MMGDDTNTTRHDGAFDRHLADVGTDLLARLETEESALDRPEAAALPTPKMVREPISFGDDEADAPTTLREAVLADVKEYYASADLDESFAAAPSEQFIEDRYFSFEFLDGRQVVEHYWVNRPNAFVVVLYDAGSGEYEYHVSEPVLDDFETYVRNDLTKILRNNLLYRELDREDDRETVFEREARTVISDHAATVEGGSLYKLLYYLLRDFIYMGPIDPLMRDPTIEDISCDGDDVPVFVYHGGYRDLRSNVVFRNGELTSFTVRLAQRAGKPISISDPLVDASLDDGSRVQLTLGTDISTRGSNFTIRKFSEVPYTPVDLIRWNTFSVEEMAYFWLAIENNKSLLFAGGTGSGKTTSMNAVSFFIPQNSKVVSIEDTREITLPHDNWIQSVTRDTFTADGRGEVSMYALLQAALRQRPEYLLVGEIRTEQRVALTFFHAIATGHTAYSTFHADSVEGVLNRMGNDPLGVPAQMLEGLDIISVQQQIYQDEDRVRRNVDVTELDATETGSIDTHALFRRDPVSDSHERVGDSIVLADIAADRGWSADDVAGELRARADVLGYLVEYDVSDYRDVAATIHAYNKNPDAVLARVRADEELPAVVELADRDADADGEEAGGEPDDGFDSDWLGVLFDSPDLQEPAPDAEADEPEPAAADDADADANSDDAEADEPEPAAADDADAEPAAAEDADAEANSDDADSVDADAADGDDADEGATR
jgi:flagellar protein FlaI